MKIDVTQEDIDHGMPKCFYDCPVALAIKRTYGIEYARVNGYILVGLKRGALTPPDVTTFIKQFDAGHYVEPFSFELPIEP